MYIAVARPVGGNVYQEEVPPLPEGGGNRVILVRGDFVQNCQTGGYFLTQECHGLDWVGLCNLSVDPGTVAAHHMAVANEVRFPRCDVSALRISKPMSCSVLRAVPYH